MPLHVAVFTTFLLPLCGPPGTRTPAAIQLPDLLKVSRRVAATKTWVESVLHQAHYQWVGTNELIYFVENMAQPRHCAIYRLNAKTGQAALLQGLSKTCEEWETGIMLQVSPDGKYLLATRGTEPPTYALVDVSGQNLGSFPIRRAGGFHDRFDPTKFTHLHWTADSKGLIESVYDIDRGAGKLTFWSREIGSLNRPRDLGSAILAVSWGMSGWPDFASREGGYKLMRDTMKDVHPSVGIVRWTLGGKTSSEDRLIAFPGEDISEWAISPDGKRILWETTTAPAGPGSWVYEPKNSKKRPKGPHYIRLWISNSDGTSKRLLGRVELKKGDEYPDWHSFGQLKFVPGGNAVSFVCRYNLYVLLL